MPSNRSDKMVRWFVASANSQVMRNRGALRLYESVGMHPTWQAERWEKALGPA